MSDIILVSDLSKDTIAPVPTRVSFCLHIVSLFLDQLTLFCDVFVSACHYSFIKTING